MRLLTKEYGLLCSAALLLACHASGQEKPREELLDARTAIARISANDPETRIEMAEAAFTRHMADYHAKEKSTPAHQAAVEWLALVDEAVSLPHRSVGGTLGGSLPPPYGTLRTVMVTLPRPEVWPEMEALVAARTPSLDRTALLILLARLKGDDRRVLALCDDYERTAGKSADDLRRLGTNAVRSAALKRLGAVDNPKLLESFLRDLTGSSSFTLTSLVSRPQAEQIMLGLLQPEDAHPYLYGDNFLLAQEVAAKKMGEIKHAPWFLIRRQGDMALAQRFLKHYGIASLVADPEATEARRLFFWNYLFNNDLNAAVKLSKDVGQLPDPKPEDWPAGKRYDLLVLQLQKRLPDRDFSDLYVSAAVASGHIPDAIKLLRGRLASDSVGKERKLQAYVQIFDLEARMGDLDALLKELQLSERSRDPKQYDPAYKFMEIALATGDVRLIDAAIAHSLTLEEPQRGFESYAALCRRGRYAEAEQIALQFVQSNPARPGYAGASPGALCEVYYLANRPQDILRLFKEFPSWEVADVAELKAQNSSPASRPLGFFAAWALVKTGQIDLAKRALRNVLLESSQCFDAYRLFNQISDGSAVSVYDEFIRAQPYNAVPVLWKGDLLHRLGRPKEAEACVQEAHKLAPVGPYDYRIKLNDLTRLLLTQAGDAKGASVYAQNVEALELARKGSELRNAGLLPQAQSTLKRASSLWPDDAALQGELASCLEQQCLHEEARQHFRMAFHLLPADLGQNRSYEDQFGGMLGVDDLTSLGLTELNALIAKNPEDVDARYARALFLVRQLRDSKQAAADLQFVVSKDPHLLGAWIALDWLAGAGGLSPSEAENTQLQLISTRYPLLELPGLMDVASIRDLAKAYDMIQRELNALPEVDTRSILPIHRFEPDSPEDRLRFDPLNARGRFVGQYFQDSTDIGNIVSLHHPTRYPFE